VHQFDSLKYSLAKAEEELEFYEAWFTATTFVGETQSATAKI
jgi:hypothetical protein